MEVRASSRQGSEAPAEEQGTYLGSSHLCWRPTSNPLSQLPCLVTVGCPQQASAHKSPTAAQNTPPKSSRRLRTLLLHPVNRQIAPSSLCRNVAVSPRSSREGQIPSNNFSKCRTRSPRRTTARPPDVIPRLLPPPPPPKPVTLIGCRGDTQNRQRRVTDARNRRPTRSVSPCPPARSTSSRRSAPRSSSAPRARTCASRAPSACPPRPSRSPPARPLAVRVPRPGTATRCASTSVSSSALPLVRRRRFSVRKVLTDHCSLNAPTEVVKQIIVNIDAGVEVEVTIAA